MKLSSLKIALTGANGFVAKNFRNFLNKKKIPVVAIARKNFLAHPLEIKIITPEYSKKKISPQLKNCNVCVHLIGIGKLTVNSDYLPVNLELTKKMVKLCKELGIKKIIYNSGLGVSKNSTIGYFISKFRAEQEIVNSGLDFTIFRPSYIIGRDDLLTKNLKKQIKKGHITIPGSGKYALQPIFINDVSKIILHAAISKNFSKKIIDLVGPETISFENYVKFFNKNRVKIKKIDLEKSLHEAIHNPKNPYGVDDLNILLGNFQGNFKTLKKISGIEFTKLKDTLETSCLS